ncbi:hemagglutinin repeat-containing protein (plasmid) [Rhizobium leguminosarum]
MFNRRQAVQVSAERDVAILTGRDVNLLSAQDQTNYEHLHEEFFAGISLSVSSGLVSAAESVQSAASGLGDNAGLYAAAPTALAAINAYRTLDSITKGDSSLASVSLTAGFTYQKSENAASSSSPVVTSVQAGGAIAIEATSGDLTGHGVQIAAGYDANGNPTVSGDANAGNVLLSAGHNITLESAQATNASSSKSTWAGASVGVGAEIGGPNGGGVGLTGSASAGMGKVGETGVTQVNSHVMGSGVVALNSGNDTTLKGAVVSGNTVIANVGGDLNIVSQQDTAAYRETTAGASIGLSPVGALSGGASAAKIKGDYANVSEQSGIVAGGGGYHVAAGGTVDLKGGVIASAADPLNNELSATALTYSNIENASSAITSGYGVVLSPSGIPLPAVDTPAKQEDHGKALATLSPGKLTLSDQKQDLASLNTDLSKANTQADFYDIETLKRRQESAAAVSQLLNMAIGEISQKLGFAEGSPEKIGLHAAAGAITAMVAGSNVGLGALAGGGQELLGAIINKALMDNPNLTQEQRNAISQWTATLVGAVIGGNQGASIALDAEKYNRQLHIKEGELIRANAARYAVQQGYCASVDTCSAEGITRAEAELTMEALRRVDSLFADVNESSAAAAFLEKLAASTTLALPDGQNLFSATPEQYANHVMNIEYLSENKELYERFGNQNESKYYTAYVHALLSAANDSRDLKNATPAQTSAVLNGLKDAIHAIEQGQAGSTGFENTVGGSETTYINLLDGMINAVTIAAGSNSSALQQFISDNHALIDGLMSNVAFESKVGKLIQVEYLLAVAGPAAASMAAELTAACRLGSQVCLTQINLLFQDFIASAPELGGTGVGLAALTTLDKEAIGQAALKVETQLLGRRVWSLNPIERGNSVESLLAQTEYSGANGWFHNGAERNGFFPLIDFQSGNTVISLKTVNTTGSSWMGRMERTIDELSGSGITINGNPANKILDIRVQPGGAAAAQALVDYGKSEGITVLIKEF